MKSCIFSREFGWSLVTSTCCDRQYAHAYLQLFSRKTSQQW